MRIHRKPNDGRRRLLASNPGRSYANNGIRISDVQNDRPRTVVSQSRVHALHVGVLVDGRRELGARIHERHVNGQVRKVSCSALDKVTFDVLRNMGRRHVSNQGVELFLMQTVSDVVPRGDAERHLARLLVRRVRIPEIPHVTQLREPFLWRGDKKELPARAQAPQVQDIVDDPDEIALKSALIERDQVHIPTKGPQSLLGSGPKVDLGATKKRIEHDPAVVAVVLLVVNGNVRNILGQRAPAALLGAVYALQEGDYFGENKLGNLLLDRKMER